MTDREVRPASAARAGGGFASAYGNMSRGKGALVVLGLFLGILIGALDQFVVLTALPNIATDLGQSNGVAFVVSSYLISATVGIVVFGRLADIYSRRAVFVVALGIFLAGSVLAGLSQNLGELITFRAVQGFAGEAFIVVAFAIVAVLFPPELRARITGIFTGTFVIATILGPFLGSFVIDHVSWRWVFYLNVPIVAIALAIVLGGLGPLVPIAKGRFDTFGSVLLTGWVAPLTFALVQTSSSGWTWSEPRTLALLATSIVLFVGFVAWEQRAPQPVLPLRLFRKRIVATSGAISFLRGMTLFSLLTFLAIYVGLILLHGASDAADTVRDVLYFLLLPAILGAGVGSQLLTKTTYRAVTGVGLGLALLGTFVLTTVSASSPTWQFAYGVLPTGGLILPLVPIGLGIGLSFPSTLLSAQFAVHQEEVGSATAMMQFLGALGGAMGVSLLTAFQQSRLAALTPTSPSVACAAPHPSLADCGSYLQAVQHAAFTSIHEVFVVVFLLTAITFGISLLMDGRMPGPSTLPSQGIESPAVLTRGEAPPSGPGTARTPPLGRPDRETSAP